MKKITLLILPLLFLISFSSFGEGTRQLMPTGDVTPRVMLQIWDNNAADRNSFTYDAPADKRLYVHAEIGDTVYYAFGTQEDGGGLYYRIRHFDSLASLVVDTQANTAMPTTGAGFITNYAQAVAGPSALVGATGYNARFFIAPRSADY